MSKTLKLSGKMLTIDTSPSFYIRKLGDIPASDTFLKYDQTGTTVFTPVFRDRATYETREEAATDLQFHIQHQMIPVGRYKVEGPGIE
jgi:hypothetical protein